MIILDFDKSWEKQPSEQKTIRLELAGVAAKLVVNGYILNTAEVKVFDSVGTDVSTTMVDGTVTVDAVNNYVFTTIKAGTHGSDYTLRLKTTWTLTAQPNQVDEKDLLILVRQKGY